MKPASELPGVRDCLHDDLREERVLVSVVVVHGALRETRKRRDILYGGTRVSLAQEQGSSRVHDGRARANYARIIDARSAEAARATHGASVASHYCTHQ